MRSRVIVERRPDPDNQSGWHSHDKVRPGACPASSGSWVELKKSGDEPCNLTLLPTKPWEQLGKELIRSACGHAIEHMLDEYRKNQTKERAAPRNNERVQDHDAGNELRLEGYLDQLRGISEP